MTISLSSIHNMFIEVCQKVRHPALDAGSPNIIKAEDAGSRSGMTVLRVKYLNKRPFGQPNLFLFDILESNSGYQE